MWERLRRIRKIKIDAMLLGLITLIPGVNGVRYKFRGGGSTGSARYCYSVWMRHLVYAHRNGFAGVPQYVAELGPGDTIGVGLAALLSGAKKYYAFDVVNYCNVEKNIRILNDLVQLFQNREPIPNDEECAAIKPVLDDYSFPHYILNNDKLGATLSRSSLKRIRTSVENVNDDQLMISYVVNWQEHSSGEKKSLDFIYSQAVLEHVEDLESAYNAMSSWLKPGGIISHQIDFKSHGTAKEWNGHWCYEDFTWRVLRGGRPYLINRQPYSVHRSLIDSKGFNIVCEIRITSESRLSNCDLAGKYSGLSEHDLTTSGVFLQARRTH